MTNFRFAVTAARPLLSSLILAIITIVLYYPVHAYPFIHYDDQDYVSENPHVTSGVSASNLTWALSTFAADNWHPLTWISHELDCQLFGLNPSYHHAVNVVFHTVNAILLFWVLFSATGRWGPSLMVAALFALHPVNVESVAWIAERKNVLSTTFFLMALGAYRWYVLRPRQTRYLLVAALFVLGLMAKPQIITLPFVLLLWDYWPLQRMYPSAASVNDPVTSSTQPGVENLVQLLWEKVPLLMISGMSAAITLKAQHSAIHAVPLHDRIGNAALAYCLYVRNAFWPTKLAIFYPLPDLTLEWWHVVSAGLLLIAISIAVFINRRHRYLVAGWFWFLGMLVPMVGIVQVGAQAMADRYAYTSFIGLFIMVCWSAAEFSHRLALPTRLLFSLSVLVLVSAGVMAHRQISYWQSDQALWAHDLQVTTPSATAEGLLGSALAMSGNVSEGVHHFRNALAIDQSDLNSNLGMATYELRVGHFVDASRYYQRALADKNARPGFQIYGYVGLAKAYRALGETGKSEEALEAAQRLQR